jgi:hypothetical protein
VLFPRCTAATLFLLAFAAVLPGCYERTETVIINPDGSGKMLIETDAAVPLADGPGKQKPTAVKFGQQLLANFINNSRGIDAWSDVAISEARDGRAHIAAVAYFPDISQVRFDLPLTMSWRKMDNGTYLLLVDRTRSAATSPLALTDEQLKDQVAKAQAQYKEKQLALQTQLNAFTLRLKFILPGAVSDMHVFSKTQDGVSLTLDGKKIATALDKFMADDEALGRTIKSGQDLTDNDDILLDAMYGQKGPVVVRVKLPAENAGGLPSFDYRTESRAAALAQHDMLEAAGVQLVAKFIVKPPASQPGGR